MSSIEAKSNCDFGHFYYVNYSNIGNKIARLTSRFSTLLVVTVAFARCLENKCIMSVTMCFLVNHDKQ